MVTHFKRVEIEEPRQLFLIYEDIDAILQRIADVGDVELPLDNKTRYEKISIGLSYLLFLLHMLEDNVSLICLLYLSVFLLRYLVKRI